MKATILFSGLLSVLGLCGMDLQDPSHQKWDAKFFYKATKQSLPFSQKTVG